MRRSDQTESNIGGTPIGTPVGSDGGDRIRQKVMVEVIGSDRK